MPRDVSLTLAPTEVPPSAAVDETLLRAVARKLAVAPASLALVRVERISFDARPRHRGWRVALRVWNRGESLPTAPPRAPPTFAPPAPDAPHAVVIGSGPAGIFAALELQAGGVRVTVIERGRDVQTRRRPIAELNRGARADRDCNYCFGEGGAGTYSDGKLYTRSGSKEEIRGVLEMLVAHGAPEEILVSWRPHVGSNRLPQVVIALRETILRSGGAIRFGARAEELEVERQEGGAPRVRAVHLRDLDRNALERLACDAVVLAAGHSALDSLLMARRAGAVLAAKGFSMGVRIEHPQHWLDERQYGGLRGPCDLPASFYEIAEQVEGRGVYSFCMCPGGFIVPTTTDPERLVVNGMSLSRRDSPFANSGLVVQIEPPDWTAADGAEWGWPELFGRAREFGASFASADPLRLPASVAEDPLFGVRLQIALETVASRVGGGANRAPVQRADHVRAARGETSAPLPTSYRPGATACDLASVLPRGLLTRISRALAAFDATLPGYAGEEGQLLGVETRTSSPVRILRDPATFVAQGLSNLYPAGEGAGHAGGIVSAALDGQRIGRALASALVSRGRA